ncbi:MAG: zinc ABC transporter substrate-binding protein [Lachnospiraceae bacterium]|nr:zinc ABC transporter substrate-binding protein [Lachnospiraceae bacterium]
MKNKYIFVTVLLLSILIVSVGFTNIYVSQLQTEKTEDEFVIVTSFYPMYIATMNIVDGIEGVTLKNLSEPQTGCLHDFQLTPEDMKLLSTADVFIINGGGIESFMEDIAKSYPKLVVIEACEGLPLLGSEEDDEHEHMHEEQEINKITQTEEQQEVNEITEVAEQQMNEITKVEEEQDRNEIANSQEQQEVNKSEVHEEHAHDHDTINAHAWMSVHFYRHQIENIANGLAQVDMKNAELYTKNLFLYDEELASLEEKQEEIIHLTQEQPTILFHCAYDYIAEDFGMEIAYCMDLDEERQISAGEIAEVLEAIEEHQVNVIFAEELYGKSMGEMIQRETEVDVVYLNPLNKGEYHKDSYLEGMAENIQLIEKAYKE